MFGPCDILSCDLKSNVTIQSSIKTNPYWTTQNLSRVIRLIYFENREPDRDTLVDIY